MFFKALFARQREHFGKKIFFEKSSYMYRLLVFNKKVNYLGLNMNFFWDKKSNFYENRKIFEFLGFLGWFNLKFSVSLFF